MEDQETSSIKTRVDDKEVLAFLRDRFDNNIPTLRFIKGGEMSQAFSFSIEGKDYVIRINSKKHSFEKDKYAFQHFGGGLIPIPRIIEVGEFGHNLFYAISEKANGVNLDEFDLAKRERLLPQLISVLDSIHKCNIDPGRYGYWSAEGRAEVESWSEYILSYRKETLAKWEENPRKYFSDKDFFEFFDKHFFERICAKVAELVPYTTEERFLVHGDYGFNNVMSDGNVLTGILDWGEARYGDFLYDVAWLAFYSNDIKFADEFEKYYRNQVRDIPHFRERVLCYQLYIGLGGAVHFAVSGQKKSYVWAKNKTLSLVQL